MHLPINAEHAVSNSCFSEATTSICMCDMPVERVLRGPNRGEYILRAKVQYAPGERVLLRCHSMYIAVFHIVFKLAKFDRDRVLRNRNSNQTLF